MRFLDRREAGKQLARKLQLYADHSNTIVLALAHGGVPVAYEIAASLRLPLDVFLVRSIGVPDDTELAIGAIASGGVRILDYDVVEYLHIPEEVINEVTQREKRELEQRERQYRGSLPMPKLRGKTVILVDDGLTTGATMKAAIMALRNHHPARVVVSLPIASRLSYENFEAIADDIICLCDCLPDPFYTVGLWYDDFRQSTDAEVRDFLEQANTFVSSNDHHLLTEPIAA